MRLPSLLGALLQHTRHPADTPPQHQEPTMAADAATPKVKVKSMMAEVELECGGEISASQEEILASPSFFDGNNGLAASPSASDEEEEEVFATPPDATQKQEEEDSVTMCTLPFTPTPTKSPAAPSSKPQSPAAPSSQPQSPAAPSSQPQSPAPPSDDDDDAAPVNPRSRKPRVCVRKVRGARISTLTPSPKQEEPEQQPPQPEQPVHVDPLVRAVLMIPARTTAATATTTSSGKDDPVENFLALCRQKGII